MHKSLTTALIALLLIASPLMMFGTSDSNIFSKAMGIEEDKSESDIKSLIKSNQVKDESKTSDDEDESKSSDDEDESKSSDDEDESKSSAATKSSDDEDESKSSAA